MKVVLVNTYDHGGAAKACVRLHEALLNENINSQILFRKSLNFHKIDVTPKPNKNICSERFLRILKKISKKILNRKKNDKTINITFLRDDRLEMFSGPNSKYRIEFAKPIREADIINLHWVADFLDYQSFFKSIKKPVVWTLHDMNPFTGGEHYEEKYLGVDENGFPIERFYTEEEIIVNDKNLIIKKRALEEFENLIIVSPSKWLAEKASESNLFKDRPIYHIPNGVNPEIFRSFNKEYSRELLNLPKDKKIILFVADSIRNNRKGIEYLLLACKDLNVELCTIGKMDGQLTGSCKINQLGPINDDRLMSVAYSASDVFVVPSLMDNLPNTIIESFMCGTPVIGFPVGGIKELIENSVNGYLVEEISVESLKIKIQEFFENQSRFNSSEIRSQAIQKYNSNLQANAYLELFKKIIK